MFRARIFKKPPSAAQEPMRPAANDSAAMPLADPFAPLPLPDVVEDNSEAAWALWMAAREDNPDGGDETLLMPLPPDQGAP